MRVPENQQKSKDLEKAINTNNICILNNKSNTYLYPFTGSYSAIDITLCDPKRLDHNNLCGARKPAKKQGSWESDQYE